MEISAGKLYRMRGDCSSYLSGVGEFIPIAGGTAVLVTEVFKFAPAGRCDYLLKVMLDSKIVTLWADSKDLEPLEE